MSYADPSKFKTFRFGKMETETKMAEERQKLEEKQRKEETRQQFF